MGCRFHLQREQHGRCAGCNSGTQHVRHRCGGVGNNVVTLNLSNVVVTQNTGAGFGGGIASSDFLSLTDVTVSNNSCGGGSCFGGGVYTNGTAATLNRVTLSGNRATGGGGLG